MKLEMCGNEAVTSGCFFLLAHMVEVIRRYTASTEKVRVRWSVTVESIEKVRP